MVMMTNPFVKFPNQPTDNFFERLGGSTLKAPSSDEVGETSGTDETRTLGVSSSRYRGGIKIATGSALIGQTLSPTKGIKFELKRTGLSSGASVSRFEIWNDTTIISSATVTFDPPTKVGTSYAYVEFFPASTVTLQANDRITIATDGGATNYYTFKSNASGSYDTTKTHWTESTYNSGSGGSWTDDTGRDGNFKFTLVTQQPSIKQHFIEWFSGKTLPSYWSSHGSGSATMSDTVNGGLLLTSPTNGAQSIDFSPSDSGKIRPFSQTGAVMIVTSKMVQAQYTNQSNGFRTNYYTEAGKYVIMSIQGQTNGNSGDNKIQLKSNNPSTSVDTSIASSAIHDLHTYKLELLSSSSTLSVDGALSSTGFATGSCNPDTRCQPYLNMATAEGTISGGAKANYRYCEVYNT